MALLFNSVRFHEQISKVENEPKNEENKGTLKINFFSIFFPLVIQNVC